MDQTPSTGSSPHGEESFSDEDLHRFAREGRILTTLLFWSGAVRELENVERLFEFIAMTGLRMGLVLTSESFRFGWPSPLGWLTEPLESGGVAPLVEVLLGSAGNGIAFESYRDGSTLAASIGLAHAEIVRRTGGQVVPSGWWPALDGALLASSAPGFLEDRPFGAFRPGAPDQEVWAGPRSAGMNYSFSTYGLGAPTVLQADDSFIVLNQTVGRWEGWSPFVNIASVRNLEYAETALAAAKKPGWLVGTLDGCLWTFSEPQWRRGATFVRLAEHIRSGGHSGRLVNVTPRTIARYARILRELDPVRFREPPRTHAMGPATRTQWLLSRLRERIRKKD